MSSEYQPTPWGETSFEADRNWYGHLPKESFNQRDKQNYQHFRSLAVGDPNFDFFDNFMPTGKPKHDVGRYVMRHGFSVPLIQSMQEWQDAVMSDAAMLRSEHYQDYAGLSGMFSSEKLHLQYINPKDETGYPDNNFELSEDGRDYVQKRLYHGPVQARLVLRNIEMLNNPISIDHRIGSLAVTTAISDMLRKGLYDGSVNPASYMRLAHWDNEQERHNWSAQSRRYKHKLSTDVLEVSRWRYVPGINIRIFRDNVIDGKYYIGGQSSHHHWEVTDGVESPDVEAHDKAGYRGRATYDSLEYTLPTGKIIQFYEDVRSLPYFDQSAAPMMELQYDEDGNLHFLQYLKTGLQLNDPGAFKLPEGDNVVTSYDVRGVTGSDGDKMRVYLDPRVFTRRMRGQGFFDNHNMSTYDMEQIAALQSRAMVMNTMLTFKDNHWSSAPLYRAPLAIGTWNGQGEVEKRFMEVSKAVPFKTVWEEDADVYYIDAIVTSNGRAATIDSDWQVKKEAIN